MQKRAKRKLKSGFSKLHNLTKLSRITSKFFTQPKKQGMKVSSLFELISRARASKQNPHVTKKPKKSTPSRTKSSLFSKTSTSGWGRNSAAARKRPQPPATAEGKNPNPSLNGTKASSPKESPFWNTSKSAKHPRNSGKTKDSRSEGRTSSLLQSCN